ncbi:hypothetical protein [Neptunicoccus cionae]|uniref:hypothetical protein n=1 Tax=Neptunicoccus cionae TaxID=2035344 RepID=UPI0011AE9FFE|nr:hypothetical protein [Amylibacter cionae]
MKMILATIAWVGGATFTLAQTDHSGHTGDMNHSLSTDSSPNTRTQLSEPGQGAFAALSEIVRVLESDPDTDWSKVDLAGVRAHLVDMDRLISEAIVTETSLEDGIHASATGNAETIAALRRMVPAHAAELARDDRWSITVDQGNDGIELRVTADHPATIARIKGLGFFGLMASQDHHRAHHLMLALGQNAHNP